MMIDLSHDPFECTFVAVDLETTGLFPRRNDRIVEVATIRFRVNGPVERVFVSLVNPERDIGPTTIHGIRSKDVIDAPRFSEIAGDILQSLHGAVLIAHNARFDWSFLLHEFERAGHALPETPRVCTLELISALSIDVPSRRLEACREFFGISADGSHDAESDAMSVVQLAHVLIRMGTDGGWGCLADFGCHSPWPSDGWPLLPASGKCRRRDPRAKSGTRERTYLGELIRQLPFRNAFVGGINAEGYFAALDRALEDRCISKEEANALFELANEWGYSAEDVIELHRAYFHSLVEIAMKDGIISCAEDADLLDVSECLGLNCEEIALAKTAAESSSDTSIAKCSEGSRDEKVLAGRTVCFTGEMQCSLNGEALSREMAEGLASEAGLTVLKSVTKKLDILVVADPNTMSGKAKKAKSYGVRIIAERVFWQSIGVRAE